MCVKCESCAVTKAIEHAPSRSLSVGEREMKKERERERGMLRTLFWPDFKVVP